MVIAMFGLACGTPRTFNEFSRDFVPLWRGLLPSHGEVCEALAATRTRTVMQKSSKRFMADPECLSSERIATENPKFY